MKFPRFFLYLLLPLLIAAAAQATAPEELSAQRFVSAESARLGGLRSLFPALSVNGHALAAPHSLEGLLRVLESLHAAIAASPQDPVRLRLGDQQLEVQRRPLNSGVKGVVYATSDGRSIVKLARGSYRGLESIMRERAIAPQAEVLVRAHPEFHTPRNFHFDPLGLYAVKERAAGETLTEHFLSRGLLQAVQDTEGRWSVRLAAEPERARLLQTDFMRAIRRNLADVLRLRPQYHEILNDIGPSNFVADARGSLQFVDLGPASPATSALYDRVQDFDSYLLSARDAANRYIAKGVLGPRELRRWSLTKAQCGRLLQSFLEGSLLP